MYNKHPKSPSVPHSASTTQAKRSASKNHDLHKKSHSFHNIVSVREFVQQGWCEIVFHGPDISRHMGGSAPISKTISIFGKASARRSQEHIRLRPWHPSPLSRYLSLTNKPIAPTCANSRTLDIFLSLKNHRTPVCELTHTRDIFTSLKNYRAHPVQTHAHSEHRREPRAASRARAPAAHYNAMTATTVDAIPDTTPPTNRARCNNLSLGVSSSPKRLMWNSGG